MGVINFSFARKNSVPLLHAFHMCISLHTCDTLMPQFRLKMWTPLVLLSHAHHNDWNEYCGLITMVCAKQDIRNKLSAKLYYHQYSKSPMFCLPKSRIYQLKFYLAKVLHYAVFEPVEPPIEGCVFVLLKCWHSTWLKFEDFKYFRSDVLWKSNPFNVQGAANTVNQLHKYSSFANILPSVIGSD